MGAGVKHLKNRQASSRKKRGKKGKMGASVQSGDTGRGTRPAGGGTERLPEKSAIATAESPGGVEMARTGCVSTLEEMGGGGGESDQQVTRTPG